MFNLNAILSAAFAQLAARKAVPARPDSPPGGSNGWWAYHAASQAKRARRALVRKVGRRQALRQIKAERRAASA